MKLLYCIPSLYNPGGMERVLTQKVNYLAATGRYSITIVTVEQGDRPVYFPLDPSIQWVDLNVDFKSHFGRNLPVKIWKHYRKMNLYKKKLAIYLQLHPVDICLSMGGKELSFLPSLHDGSLKVAEMHFVRDYKMRFQALSHSGNMSKRIGAYLSWRLDEDIRRFNHLVVLSKAEALAWQPVSMPITQIYNPVNPVEGIDTDKMQKKIIAVGRLEPEKGFHHLIEAWQRVAVKHPDWTLHIWGNGSVRTELEKQIGERGLEKQVLLKGTTSDITHEYLTSYANVASSLYEGFPMSLLEAMACRLPLVSFDCPSGPGELVREGENGFLVPVGDTEALAERLCRLIESPGQREEMAAASLRYSEMYHTEVIMQQWMNLFDALLDIRK